MERTIKNLLIMLLFATWVLFSTRVIASPAIPGERCQVKEHSSWSEAEAWAWKEICEGRIANFNQRHGNTLNPETEYGWNDSSEERRLSQRFIESLLLHDPWASSIPRQGARFIGAIFPEGIDLSAAKISHEVWFNSSLVLRNVNLIFSSFDGFISMDGSTFDGKVWMDGMLVAGNLHMRDAATFKDEVRLVSAKVGGLISMVDSTFEGDVLMDGLQVSSSLYMYDDPETQEETSFRGNVRLRGAKIGGQLGMDGSTFEGEMTMDNMHVADNLYMRGPATFKGEINLHGVKVGGNLDLSEALVSSLDLEGSKIAGGLHLGTKEYSRTRWPEGGKLILSNAQMDWIQDRLDEEGDSWPPEIHLDGLIYKRLGVSQRDGSKSGMIDREISWYITWLARDPNYSPQPYKQLASVFREAGFPAKSNAILFAGRERDRIGSSGLTRLGLESLKWTIGYGLGRGYFRALWWVAGLVILGIFVLRISGEGKRNRMPYGLSFSLDHLLPVIHLRKYHFDITLIGWARYYFYVHKLMGYILASFLIAGMAGLTQ